MDSDLRVLGIASRVPSSRLAAVFVRAVLRPSGEVSLDVHEPWSGTLGTDDGRQLTDLRDTVANALDIGRADPFDAVAVKRVETPPRGRPTEAYDKRIRFEAAVMLGCLSQGCRYFAYRKSELGRGLELLIRARDLSSFPGDEQTQEAVAAACAALHDLSEAAERGV
jgi:hypothetical protein